MAGAARVFGASPRSARPDAADGLTLREAEILRRVAPDRFSEAVILAAAVPVRRLN